MTDWPTHPDGRPKRFGDMTRDEKTIQLRESCERLGAKFERLPRADHRINYGRLFPGKSFKADCTCGWSNEGERDNVLAAVREHETTF